MINRRTLLSTLSALVAAPLAKWLPKEELAGPMAMPMTLPMSFHHTIAHYTAGCGISLCSDGTVIEIDESVPQEEA